MALDTLAKEVQKEAGDVTSIDVGMGNIIPVVSYTICHIQNNIKYSCQTSKEEWYARQGYETYKQGPGYTYQTPDKRSIQLRVSYMKKRISGEDAISVIPESSDR